MMNVDSIIKEATEGEVFQEIHKMFDFENPSYSGFHHNSHFTWNSLYYSVTENTFVFRSSLRIILGEDT